MKNLSEAQKEKKYTKVQILISEQVYSRHGGSDIMFRWEMDNLTRYCQPNKLAETISKLERNRELNSFTAKDFNLTENEIYNSTRNCVISIKLSGNIPIGYETYFEILSYSITK